MISHSHGDYVITQSTLSRKFNIVFLEPPTIYRIQNRIVGLATSNNRVVIKLTQPMRVPQYPGSQKSFTLYFRHIEHRVSTIFDLYLFVPSIWDYLLPALIHHSPSDVMAHTHLTKAFINSDLFGKSTSFGHKVFILYRPFTITKAYEQTLRKLKTYHTFSRHFASNVDYDILEFTIPQTANSKLDAFITGSFSRMDSHIKSELCQFAHTSNLEPLIRSVLYKDFELKRELERKLGMPLDKNAELHEPLDLEANKLQEKHLITGGYSYENLPTPNWQEAFG